MTSEMPVIWRIYYGDGATYSSDDGSPLEAPPMNVQAIAEQDPDVGRSIWHGKDFYLWRDGIWHGVDWFGVLDHLMEMGLLKTGRTISTDEFRAIYQQAVNDPEFPPKSALATHEQAPR